MLGMKMPERKWTKPVVQFGGFVTKLPPPGLIAFPVLSWHPLVTHHYILKI